TPGELEAQRAIGSMMASVGALLREGMAAGLFRAANVQHLLLTLVGLTVFPFASGEFGAEVLGKDIFDPAEVRRRKRELRDLLRFGLAVDKGRGGSRHGEDPRGAPPPARQLRAGGRR